MRRTIMQMAVDFTTAEMGKVAGGHADILRYECLPRRMGDREQAEKAYRGFYMRGAQDALRVIEEILAGEGDAAKAVRLIGRHIKVMGSVPRRDRSPTFWGELSKQPGQANKI